MADSLYQIAYGIGEVLLVIGGMSVPFAFVYIAQERGGEHDA